MNHTHEKTLPSMAKAVETLDCWNSEARAWGAEPSTLCGFIDARDPEHVVARLGTRETFLVAFRETPAFVEALRVQDPRGTLRVFMIDQNNHSTVGLADLVRSIGKLLEEEKKANG